jgi:signal transduction histidine kinase
LGFSFGIEFNFIYTNKYRILENEAVTNIKLIIILGVLITFFLAVGIIFFVIYYQRKMLLKDAQLKIIESQKQLELFNATVEAEENQKDKIARNLHDDINPLLTILKYNISKHRIEIQKNKFHLNSFNKDEEILDKAIEGIRTACLELIPINLKHYGFIQSLETFINDVHQLNQINAVFHNKITPEQIETFNKQEQLNIYRICLEITNNLFKHSGCTQFTLGIFNLNNNLCFEFLHNGKGVTNEEMKTFTENSNGLGLKSLKARSLILNAKLDYQKNQNLSSIKLLIPFKNEKTN